MCIAHVCNLFCMLIVFNLIHMPTVNINLEYLTWKQIQLRGTKSQDKNFCVYYE